MTRVAAALVFVLMGAVPLAAQTTPPPPPPAPPAPVRASSFDVRIEVNITDTFGATPSKKTVTMLVSEGHSGRIRSGLSVAIFDSSGHQSYQSIGINVDATPGIRPDGRIDLQLGVQYTPEPAVASGGGPAQKPAEINETLSTILLDGKPTVISQSADPQSDRKVTLEVTATVVR